MKFYWLSWYQPTEDERPLTFPPAENVLAWWNSGQRMSDDAWTLVACVMANSEDEAKQIIRVDWPEASEWRFCRERDKTELDFGDRFLLSDWMKPRLERARSI